MRVLTCTDWDEGTHTCHAEAWTTVDAVWLHMLPTVEQAGVVGLAILAAVVLVSAMAVLKPHRGITDEQ